VHREFGSTESAAEASVAFTEVETCGFLQLPKAAGLPTLSNELSEQADCAAKRPKMVTVLVTHATVGYSYQTNSKEDMLHGGARKKPNVLSPIWMLRMNRLRESSSHMRP
jgi:hypothetical protein